MNKYDVNGRIAVVAGACRGAGRAIALRLVRDGAKAVGTDVNQEDCQAIVKEIEGVWVSRV